MTRLRLLAILLVLLMPALADAQSWAKINDIRVDDDGSVHVWSTVLDRYGRAPEVSDFEFIEVSLGEANSFSGDELQADTFANAGPGTEYVIIIPGYEGFGINNAEAAAQGELTAAHGAPAVGDFGAWHEAFRWFGSKPKKYRCSAEALS